VGGVDEGPDREEPRQELPCHHRPPPVGGDDVEDLAGEEVDEVDQGRDHHQGGRREDRRIPRVHPPSQDLRGPPLEGEAGHEAVDGGEAGEVEDEEEGGVGGGHRWVISSGWYLGMVAGR